MAFQQPTRQPVQRVARPATSEQNAASGLPLQESSQRQLEDSQTWVLFSPATDVTTTSYLTETEHSLETPGRSLVSDLGSRNTAAGSAQRTNALLAEAISAIDDESVEDDAELDSLDGHLPGFRSRPGLMHTLSHRSDQHSTPVLPAHDGLGSFRLDQPTLGRDAQNQIYQFERFNPRRVRRRLDSIEHSAPEAEPLYAQETEKRQRIEAWRLEHSRMLLDEVQRETRRRRKSQASLHRVQKSGNTESDNMTWHDEDPAQRPVETEGFIAKITRKVVRDLLGIDDMLLSILLGEALPEDDTLSATPRASQLGAQARLSPLAADESSWQLNIMERVSRELGLMVNELSEHPGAFSTYTKIQQMAFPYAGLPVIPESCDTPAAVETVDSSARPSQPSLPEFQPTIPQQSQPMDIPGRATDARSEGTREDVAMANTFSKDEWEKDLDIKLVFRYLLSRFTSRSNNAQSTNSSHHGSGSGQDSMAKAARVRQHHPLISRSRPTERRAFRATTPSSPVALRHHSSCASQSTRRSARRSSCSSRHYWDIGGSLGTGSLIASHGPMGSWGEI